MNDGEARGPAREQPSDEAFLDAFGAWLRTLGRDAEQLGRVLVAEGVGDGPRKAAVGGLNYLFKSLELIPDGIDDIGYLDDAFVLRVAAAQAAREGGSDHPALAELGADEAIVRAFLGATFERLDRYVQGLRGGAARGRTVQDILSSHEVTEEFLEDVKSFAIAYRAPSFAHDPKNLIKLRAFFDAKLPKA